VTTLARLRRGVRRESLGVEIGAALNLVGALTRYLSLVFLVPFAVALGYGEPVWPFLITMLVAAVSGWSLERMTAGKERVGAREGYLVVSVSWLLLALFGSLPYLLSGEEQLSSPVDAYFEAMSGFSTTGSSVLTDIEALNHSLAIWRQFTQWLGGMGIIVLFLAVLPRLRVGGRQLLELEAPGPEMDLQATVRQVAQRFLLVYVALTALEIVVLTGLAWTRLDSRMSFYEAVAHAFTTIPTGGFSTQARSIEDFGAATQWAITAFMLLAGINFVLLYRGIWRRRPSTFARDEEFRAYLVLLAAASLIVLIELDSQGILAGEAAFRHALFNTVSIMSTTGYASTDFNQWTSLTALVLVGLMFISASAGSTSGSIKLVRHVVIAKSLRRELDQTLHPELISPVRLNGRPIDERTLRAIIVFAFLYIGIAAAGALGILLDSARADVAVTPFQAIAASATTLGGVGPGFGFAGPMGSFDPFSDVSKLLATGLMWLGRLELIPIVVLFTKSYWRA
jgi:trk system potassium uptake protein